MDASVIRDTIVNRAHQFQETFEQAGRMLVDGFGVDQEPVMDVVDELVAQASQTRILDSPPGVYKRVLENEVRLAAWYTGPQPGDKFWPPLQNQLFASSMREFVPDIDRASTKVVAHLAHPAIRGNSKKGLVVGHVQSGKTANYASVIAKSADAGYRLVIVLSGLHNNLRQQTQRRLDYDLDTARKWVPLTTDEKDFGTVTDGTALMANRNHMLAVVKKNASRLKRLRDWLHLIPEETRKRCLVLLIDDEADQATPNSKAAREDMSRINELLREIWSEIPTGTYVGYTATPFANVFMDPNDETDLYPEDFIIDLPRPANYFGARRIFGLGTPADAEFDEGLDMVRLVSDDEADALRAPHDRLDREYWEPGLPDSLASALAWFLVATAIRRARAGATEHSSMLVHTSPYVAAHFRLSNVLAERLAELNDLVAANDLEIFKDTYDAEYPRVTPLNGNAAVEWDAVQGLLPAIVAEARIVVDNGVSTDRVDYNRHDEFGNEIAETIIAVGGGTLSRGLTLEGLVVSFFTRVAQTYDSLLQMGRWFGYRPGYEECPRIWLTSEARDHFQFLATVELEIREEMARMERMGVSPAQVGLRVRAHPGALAITAANKMYFAEKAQISFSGQRHQTISFHESDETIQTRNLAAVRHLMAQCEASSSRENVGSDILFRGIKATEVVTFLHAYEFHPDQVTLRGDHVVKWLEQFAEDADWSVAVVSRAKDAFGTTDIGLSSEVNSINRAPLSAITESANIKALVSRGDEVLDLDPNTLASVRSGEATYSEARRHEARGRGLLVVYPISEKSVPRGASVALATRRPLESTLPLVGLAIVFPEVLSANAGEDGTFMAVVPDWNADEELAADEYEEFRRHNLDTEGDTVVDGTAAEVDPSVR